MAKQKAIEPETLIKLLDEYRFDSPSTKITIPQFGTYVRNKGYNVQDYTIRRSAEFRAYQEKLNDKVAAEENIISDLVTYKTLDVDDFLEKNRTQTSLKNALVTRDRYYARVAANAVAAIKARKELEKKNRGLEERVATLEKQQERLQAKADNAEIRQKNEAISKLVSILDGYIYPDAANAILEKEGLLKVVSTIVPKERMKEKTIDANTDVSSFKYDSVNDLLGGFDD